MSNSKKANGLIAKYIENGFPVILKLVNEFPDHEIRTQYPQLTIISWKYDGEENNGMPLKDAQDQMFSLESSIYDELVARRYCTHVYSRTGNSLKELVYYSISQKSFIKELNEALKSHPHYPIEINFYEDENWEDFRKLLDDVKPKK